MMNKYFGRVLGAIALMFFGGVTQAQDIEENDVSHVAAPPPVRYAYNSTADPLKMLQDVIAANEELLKKQRAFSAVLADLEQKAKANRASAASSARKGGKK